MKVSIETTQGLERQLTVEVPAERVDSEVQTRIRSLARGAKLPGFRPGKVPLKIIEKKYGEKVRQDVLNELVQSSLSAALREHNLRPAGNPKIETGAPVSAGALAYTATFDIYPEIQLKSLEGVEIHKPVATITEDDVERTLDDLRKQHLRWTATERSAHEGDRVTIDFHGKIAGDDFPGNSAENFSVVIGSNSLVGGFEEQLSGHRAGDSFTVTAQFPEDYRATALAGKEAAFEVTLRTVEEGELPALDDAFAEEFGVKSGGLEALKAGVRKGMQTELERVIKDRVKHAVLEALLAAHPLELPASLVEAEINGMMQEARAALGEQAVDLERNRFEESARRKVALGLLEAEIIRSQQMRADPEKLRDALTTLAAEHQNPQEVVRWYLEDRARLAGVEAFVLEDQVVEWLLKQVKVVEEPTSYKALMRAA